MSISAIGRFSVSVICSGLYREGDDLGAFDPIKFCFQTRLEQLSLGDIMELFPQLVKGVVHHAGDLNAGLQGVFGQAALTIDLELQAAQTGRRPSGALWIRASI